jgi:hypothetical protein
MKTLSTLLTITTIALSSAASAKTVEFRPADNSFESKVCYVAASQGLDSAYDLIRENDINLNRFIEQLSCNGKSLKRVSRLATQLNQNTSEDDQSESTTTRIRFVTNENPESEVCKDAVVLGVDEALEKHDMKRSNIICNGLKISRFAKRFSGKAIEL